MHKLFKEKEIILELFVISLVLFFWGGGWGSPFVGPSNFIDEGQFGAWINHMSYGEHLFKDIFIVYGPLSVYPLFWLAKIFGSSIFLIREYLTFGALPGFAVLYLLSKRLSFPRALRYLLYIVFLLLPILSMRQGMFMLGLYCMISSYNGGYVYRFISGIAIAVSLFVSQEYGIFLTILFLIRACFEFFKKKGDYKYVLTIILGMVSSFLVFAFMAISGGWFLEYIRDTIDVITSFSGQNVPNGMNFPKLFEIPQGALTFLQILKIPFDTTRMYYYSLFVYVVAIQYLITAILKKKLEINDCYLLFVILAGLLIMPSLITRPGIANFFGLLWPVIIILFYFINILISEVAQKKKNIVSLLLLGLCFLFIVRIISLYRPNLIQRMHDISKIPMILGKNNSIQRVGSVDLGKEQTGQVLTMKHIVDKHSKEGEFVFFFNDEPMYYFLFNRRNPTRFDLPFAANTLRKRYEILDSIRLSKTKLIIVDRNVWAVDGINNARRLPELYAYILKHYKRVDTEEKSIVVFIKK